MNKLNLGCGYVMPDDWVNIDSLDYGGNVIADILEGLPFPDNHFDCIVMNHTLQMIRFDDLERALREVRRVLKEGGILRVLVPDPEWAIALYNTGQADRLPISNEIEATPSGKLLRYLFWHGDARSAFTDSSLKNTLERNGFKDTKYCDFRQTFSDYYEVIGLDSREDESVIVEATK